jgi:lytic murein transglycosylase
MKAKLILITAALGLSLSATAKTCGGSFSSWLSDFKQEAKRKGVSSSVINNALRGVTEDPQVLKLDRKQSVFAQDFLQFSSRMADGYRLGQGKKKIRGLSSYLRKIEARYGVPKEVIVAFWGLETDFGANTGNFSTFRSLATLAHDCRRPELFRPQLLAALKIVQKGHLPISQMKGAWAGEIGQTQLLPSDYLEKGVDMDGNGKIDLRRSSADALATSARVIKGMGWRRGQPWLKEVKVPNSMPWEEADLKIKHTLSQWGKWGVRYKNGGKVSGGSRASLILPLGKNGPAFLAYPNFGIFTEWNKSFTYALTAAYYATRLAGASKVSKGKGNYGKLSLAEVKQVQQKLQRKGYDVGKPDGVIGAGTRAAVKNMQKKLGLPADSWPNKELLRKLR